MFNRIRKRQGEAWLKPTSPHDLRRTFAGDLLDARVDLSTVQELMGHASPTTAQHYDRRNARRERAAALRVRMPYVSGGTRCAFFKLDCRPR